MQKALFLVLLFIVSVARATTSDWVTESKKIYTASECRKHQKMEAVFFKKKVPVFTQLIFSWNVVRPTKGFFSFYVRVFNKQTQQWDSWHHMLDWGQGVQKSFFSRGSFSVYNYARLELEHTKADAFEIKVTATHKKLLHQIKGLFVVTSDFTQFKREPYAQRGQGLASCRVKGVIPKSQIMIDHPRANALCSPTSVSMLVAYFSGKSLDLLETARMVYDEGLDVFGNWGFNMAYAYNATPSNLFFYTTRLHSFADLHALLAQNIPVAVSVRGAIKGAKKEYNNGHLMVVMGYNAPSKKVLCCDPAFDSDDQVYQEYDLHEFIVAWERSRRLTYKPQVVV